MPDRSVGQPGDSDRSVGGPEKPPPILCRAAKAASELTATPQGMLPARVRRRTKLERGSMRVSQRAASLASPLSWAPCSRAMTSPAGSGGWPWDSPR